MSRRAQFLEVLGIATEWIPRKPPGVPEDAGAVADFAPVTTAEREVPAEPLPVQAAMDAPVTADMVPAEDFAEPEPAVIAEAPIVAPARDREAAIAAMDWPALDAAVAGCTACGLCHTRTNTVFGVGDRQAE